MHLLRKILWPFSLLYGLGVFLRNLTYDLGWRGVEKFRTPTVCVGNLSLGGTGKTPMIEWLIRQLSADYQIAVLSRGYKRKSSGFLVAQSDSSALEIGDEPLQIYRKFPSVVVAVDGNRKRGISNLEATHQPDIILLDDAFQHRKVKADFYILLTTYHNLYTSDHYLPTGTLRDSKNQAKRANIIVVTKCPPELDVANMVGIRKELRPSEEQEVLFCALSYSSVVVGEGGELSLNELTNRPVTVVTGIASPEPLLRYLTGFGLKIRHLKFRDHHQFTSPELSDLSREEMIITTEKDYVRGLKQLPHVYFLEIQHRFLGDGKQRLLDALKDLQG